MRDLNNWGIVDAEAFLLYCLRTIGGGYHPDTPMSDYRDMDGNPTFSEGEVKEFQAMHDWALGLIPDEEEMYAMLTRAKEAIWPGSTPAGGKFDEAIGLIEELIGSGAFSGAVEEEAGAQAAINHLAWGVVRKYGMTWKQAYHHAVNALSMKERLSSGVVEFSFTKVSDGSVRAAKGTRDLSAIPAEFHPKGTSTKPETTNVVSFFDIENNGWRSFDISNLVPTL